ncbi:MAG: GtrA family protein, partial [Egibacteraceae bacterium]
MTKGDRIRRPARTEQPPPAGTSAARAAAAAAALSAGALKPSVYSASWRYALVGATGVLVNLAVLHVLHGELGLGFLRSSAMATETAILCNYLGNELWTFHHRRLAWRRLVTFNVSALAGLVATVTVA